MLENLANLLGIILVVVTAVLYAVRQKYELNLLQQEVRRNHKDLKDLINISQNTDEKELVNLSNKLGRVGRTLSDLIAFYNQDRSDRDLNLFYTRERDQYEDEI